LAAETDLLHRLWSGKAATADLDAHVAAVTCSLLLLLPASVFLLDSRPPVSSTPAPPACSVDVPSRAVMDPGAGGGMAISYPALFVASCLRVPTHRRHPASGRCSPRATWTCTVASRGAVQGRQRASRARPLPRRRFYYGVRGGGDAVAAASRMLLLPLLLLVVALCGLHWR
jgi:hypothetical protein